MKNSVDNSVDLEHPPMINFASMPLILNVAIKKKHFAYALFSIVGVLLALIINHLT